MQLIAKPDHGLMARMGLETGLMSREEKRAWQHMRPGRRVEEARATYNELKRWAVAHNDEAVAYNLVTKFYKYVRMDRPLAMSKSKSDELRKLYDNTRDDIRAAHYEDVANA